MNGMGAEKRQCLSPAQISAHRKSVRNRSKALGVLSSPAFAPARSHSGSQGRRRGFCGLFGQRILYAATLGGGWLMGQLFGLFGVSRFAIDTNPLMVGGLTLGLALVFLVAAYASARKVRRVDVRELVAE